MPDTLPPRTPSSKLGELRQEMTRQLSQKKMLNELATAAAPIRTRRSQKTSATGTTSRRMSADGGRDPYTMAMSSNNATSSSSTTTTNNNNNSSTKLPDRAMSHRRRRMSNEFSKPQPTQNDNDVAMPLPSLRKGSGNHRMVTTGTSSSTISHSTKPSGRTVRAASRRRRSLDHEVSSSTATTSSNSNSNSNPYTPQSPTTPRSSATSTSAAARPASTRRGMRSNLRGGGTRRASLDSNTNSGSRVAAARFQF